jgi:hypothetical protein
MTFAPQSSTLTSSPKTFRYYHREIHYRRVASGQGFLKVVVQYRPVPPQGTWAGEVITAYRVKKRKSREVLLEP